MRFADIVGQEELKTKLITSVRENRVSHAQLFWGPEGSGKLALAIAYARYVSCTARTETDACDTCPSCIKYNKLAHPDLHFFFPNAATTKVAKKNMSKLFANEWREFVIRNNYYVALEDWYAFIGIEKKQAVINTDDCNEIIRILSLKAYESEYKVIIIYMVEKIFHSAAPKLLKILEEPPEKTLFLLICESYDQVLGTIVSRSQLVKVRKHSHEELIKFINQHYELHPTDVSKIATIADGNICEVRRLSDVSDIESHFDNFRTWMRACYSVKFHAIVDWIDEMAKASGGRENLKRFLQFSLKMTRNCMLFNNTQPNTLLNLTTDEMDFVSKFSPFLNNRIVNEVYVEINTALAHIERNLNNKIVLMDTSFKIMRLLKS